MTICWGPATEEEALGGEAWAVVKTGHGEAHGIALTADRRTALSTIGAVPTFVFRLQAPRPTFALDMTDGERAVMERHAAHWRPLVDNGQMVVFGPVLDGTGSWGLGVIDAEDEAALRDFAANDPAVITGTATIEVGKMLTGFVRGA
jgi:uncharacterized protein YciI